MSWDNNNLACILVFPPWQRKGMGKILMGVSYELSKREGRVGGPEKRMLYFQYYPSLPSLLALKPPPELKLRHAKIDLPTALSTLGKRGYLSFWSTLLATHILTLPPNKSPTKSALKNPSKTSLTIATLSTSTSMLPEDIITTLKSMNVLGPKKRGAESGSLTISKAKVRDWARRSGVDLVPPVDEDGFVERWEGNCGEEEEEG